MALIDFYLTIAHIAEKPSPSFKVDITFVISYYYSVFWAKKYWNSNKKIYLFSQNFVFGHF